MELKVNWDHKRCKHAIERMWLRGITKDNIREAISKGQKHIQKETGLIEAFYQFYSIVYQEYNEEMKLRKIYPITVKLW